MATAPPTTGAGPIVRVATAPPDRPRVGIAVMVRIAVRVVGTGRRAVIVNRAGIAVMETTVVPVADTGHTVMRARPAAETAGMARIAARAVDTAGMARIAARAVGIVRRAVIVSRAGIAVMETTVVRVADTGHRAMRANPAVGIAVMETTAVRAVGIVRRARVGPPVGIGETVRIADPAATALVPTTVGLREAATTVALRGSRGTVGTTITAAANRVHSVTTVAAGSPRTAGRETIGMTAARSAGAPTAGRGATGPRPRVPMRTDRAPTRTGRVTTIRWCPSTSNRGRSTARLAPS
ncbi:hypothetical protein FLP10_01605 [Agromyces intestinalis]|uniref:Uncharacterized protein n=1 Tax=Agromyces intestinalis TaxID=2592652 RepID=A0A5C1YD05_9MICO|nr:hypothetical protein [Agromyces intestinalis]QEO13255.1 hypothetical protein FLP10_01605 [Agromyces intestinalis]